MEEITNWTGVFINSLKTIGTQVALALPKIVGAIIILFLGWLLAKLISGVITRLLKAVGFDQLAEKFQANNLLEKANIQMNPSKLVGRFTYWLLMLLVIITATDTMGWNSVSREISHLLGYLPKLLVGVVFFIIGMFIATFVRDFIRNTTASLGITVGKILSSFVFYILAIIVTLTAMDQAGIDTSIITSNLLLILGTIFGAAAISYSISSKEIVSNVLASFFSRKIFRKGQTIQIGDIRGEIIETNSISVVIRTGEKEKVVIPSNKLISSDVKIIE